MKKNTLSTTQINQLFKLAKQARLKAHAPYSKYQIGAAVLFENGLTTSGCNIENASYGGTVCAERVAIWNGISSLGLKKTGSIAAVCVVSDEAQPWPPCGFCRQVISEFFKAEKTLIILANTKKVTRVLPFSELFPEAFTPEHLKVSYK